MVDITEQHFPTLPLFDRLALSNTSTHKAKHSLVISRTFISSVSLLHSLKVKKQINNSAQAPQAHYPTNKPPSLTHSAHSQWAGVDTTHHRPRSAPRPSKDAAATTKTPHTPTSWRGTSSRGSAATPSQRQRSPSTEKQPSIGVGVQNDAPPPSEAPITRHGRGRQTLLLRPSTAAAAALLPPPPPPPSRPV